MAVETFDVQENGVVLVEASITYDEATFQVTRVDWQNNDSRDWFVTVFTPTKAPLEATLRAGRSGTVRNVANGYLIDGPRGAGYSISTSRQF